MIIEYKTSKGMKNMGLKNDMDVENEFFAYAYRFGIAEEEIKKT